MTKFRQMVWVAGLVVVGVPTVAISITHPRLGPDRLAAALRAGRPPVVVRVAEDRLLVDLRTVPPEQEVTLLEALVLAGEAAFKESAKA